METMTPANDEAGIELQFGLELEFVAPPDPYMSFGYAGFIERELKEEACFLRFAKVLGDAGLPAAFGLCLAETECGDNPHRIEAPAGTLFDNWRVIDPDTIDVDYANVSKFQYWLLKAESLESKVPRTWIGTELNSPILHQSEVQSGLPHVKRALKAIFNECKPLGAHINSGCGLHVHVSPISGLTDIHVKCVAAMLFIIDNHLLYELTSSNRRDEHSAMNKTTFASINHGRSGIDIVRRASAAGIHDYLPKSLLDRYGSQMRNLWEAEGLSDISRAVKGSFQMRGEARATLRVSLVNTIGGMSSDTLEFRHAQASFSHKFVGQWTALILAIFKVACLPAPKYKRTMRWLFNITSTTPKPQDAWLSLLHTIRNSVPDAWAQEIDVPYWVERVQENRVKAEPDVGDDGMAIMDD
ncbi:hypothetical protein CDD81_2184 [Ophiocordyceps australis]|uniref:Amidoligase enzyme n=1 Tax=Ophiocordyceps australis TaxID=1399860 RepID=A0A2C5XX65_9HYPO|nr:hypothetical protein CDD81_2184 [Ophiocordyceps australis]